MIELNEVEKLTARLVTFILNNLNIKGVVEYGDEELKEAFSKAFSNDLVIIRAKQRCVPQPELEGSFRHNAYVLIYPDGEMRYNVWCDAGHHHGEFITVVNGPDGSIHVWD